MPDLVSKYFRQDLTEAEQEALEQSLLNSDEAAFQFEELAKAAYGRYGLPEPQPKWDDSLPPPSVPRSGLGPTAWTFLGLVGIGLAIFSWQHPPAFIAAARAFWAAPPVSVSSAPSEKGNGKGIASKKKPALDSRITSKTGVETREGREEAVLETKSAVPAAVVARPETTPVNLDLSPPKSYSNLSVEINQTQLGFLTVRVVDPRGAEVTLLYKGNLTPGRWMFEWDGKLANGGPATPGFYQIEVRSGATVQQKSIQIQKRAP